MNREITDEEAMDKLRGILGRQAEASEIQVAEALMNMHIISPAAEEGAE